MEKGRDVELWRSGDAERGRGRGGEVDRLGCIGRREREREQRDREREMRERERRERD